VFKLIFKIGYVIENIVSDIINNTKDSLGSFTIDDIYKISSIVSSDQQNTTNLKKRQRKQNLIDEVDSLCFSARKHQRILNQKTAQLPSIVGTIIATCGDKILTYDIPNPSIKPFVMVGRQFDESKQKQSHLRLDQVDFNVDSFPESMRVSRNNMKVRYNPFTSQIEVLLIARNEIAIIQSEGNVLQITDKSKWIPITPGDIIVQNTTAIRYSFTNVHCDKTI
jgi:hypothetical protein